MADHPARLPAEGTCGIVQMRGSGFVYADLGKRRSAKSIRRIFGGVSILDLIAAVLFPAIGIKTNCWTLPIYRKILSAKLAGGDVFDAGVGDFSTPFVVGGQL